MPVFFEFLLIACLIYLWESALWLPKQGIALRRGWFGKKWRVIPAGRLLATRELGLVPMLPIPPDLRLLPCPGFPLVSHDSGKIFIETTAGGFLETSANCWYDFRLETHHLSVDYLSVRCQSPRLTELLREGKNLGLDPHKAIRRAWNLALSPARAKREMKRWSIVSRPLRFYGPILACGFFAAIPTAYLTLGPMAALWLAAWLWCLMIATAIHLLWLGKNVFPSARSEFRQDAFLSVLIPFHAMRALELASVHVFAQTHPAGVLVTVGEINHPWLRGFARRLLHPRPSNLGDLALSETALPSLKLILDKRSFALKQFDHAPDRSNDLEAVAYCPRCHGMFLSGTETCSDCGGLALRGFQ
ncbi:MAG: hypothetical protein H7Y36_06220 [Armatimonadetes bacterium]|nr:hypothetical protein [Akkermansiaceae bacterium]